MADNETITDIIKKTRAEADYIEETARGSLKAGENYDGIAYTKSDLESALDLAETKRKEADRLEAAHKRERGNSAALREALKHIKDRLPHMLQYMRVHWEDANAGGYFDELMLVIDAALSAPPRNCDIYLTEEAVDAATVTVRDCEACSRIDMEAPCVFCMVRWLLAPATEQEGGTDGNE